MRQSAGEQESVLSYRSGSWSLRDLLPAAVLVVVTFLVYVPAMRAGFVWDDDSYVTDNPALWAPEGLRRIWLDPRSTPQYYPLVFTALRFEYDLWGFHPFGYHAVNILLHAASALLLWRLLRSLRVPGAWAAALLFAVHPVHVESVAWVTELKNMLSGFFYLAALWAALRFYLPFDSAQGGRRWGLYAGAFLLFGCALLSKTVTCSLPAAVLLVLWWKRGRFSRFEVATLLPFFVLGAALAFNTAALEKSHVGAVGPEWDLSFLERILIAGRALWFYAGKLVWPVPLTFIYPRWEVNAAVPWQYLFPLAALAVLAVLWRLRGRIGRGPLAATLFFALTLVPALGFVNVYPMLFSFVADHFQYLASIGLIALVVAGAASWAGRRWRPATFFCGAAVVTALGAVTWDQCHAYRDVETLWLDTISKNPDAWVAWNYLAVFYQQAGRDEEAIRFYDKAIELNQTYALAYNNRAAELSKLRRYSEALDDCNTAIRLKPGWASPYNNRGNVHLGMNRLDEALGDFSKAIECEPDYAMAWCNRGLVHGRMGRYDLAIPDFDAAIRLLPGYADAYCKRAVAFLRLQRYDDALRDCNDAIKLDPKNADTYDTRAVAHIGMGEYQLAVDDCDQALRLDPDFALVWYNRGEAHDRMGRYDLAIPDFDAAIRLLPDYANAYYARAIARYGLKRYEQAWEDVKMSQKLGGQPPDPDFLKALSQASSPPK